jgi:dTDP-4-dehydrorhamnose reductase
MPPEVVLIVGADGMIGSALAQALPKAGWSLLETTRRPESAGGRRLFFDLSEPAAPVPLPDPPSLAFLCAGVTSVEACERDPKATEKINVTHTLMLARRLIGLGTRIVFLSTNIVFNGSKPQAGIDDEPDPKSEYGRQKLAVERELLGLDGSSAVVRLTKVLGPRPPLFMEWVRRLRAGQAIEPFRDKVMAPVPLPFVVDVLLRLGERGPGGILQVSGPRDVTYYEIAAHIAGQVGADPGLVRPIDGKGKVLAAGLAPVHTTLDTRRLRAEFGLEPPDIWPTIEWSLT